VDVLMYTFISSAIASIPYYILPTLSPSFVFPIVALAAVVGMILVWVLAPYVDRLIMKRRKDEAGLNDLSISQLWWNAKQGFMDLLKLNLKMMKEMFDDGRIPYRFKSWDETDPELKKRLVTNTEYDALDEFAKSLTQCPRPEEPNFDVMSQLCKTHYERLKRLGLVS